MLKIKKRYLNTTVEKKTLYTTVVNNIILGGKGCIIDASMAEGLAYLGTFVTMYKDLDMLWNVPYASFSGDCPIYRFAMLYVQISAFESLSLVSSRA